MKRNLILLCTLLCMSMAARAVQVWDGTSAEIWTKGGGTESDPYLIETPANLQYLAYQVSAGNAYANTYFLQTEDFDLNSKSLSIGSKTFSGNYDGGNHQILNVSNYLFYTLQSATIQNLTIAGNTKYPLVYQVNGKATLTNCHNKSTAEITNGGAGLISQAKSGCVTLTRCSNSATIHSYWSSYSMTYSTYYKYASGLVLHADSVVMRNCHNFGNITIYMGDGNHYIYIGGLVALTNYVDILKSSNTAELTYNRAGGTLKESTRAGIALASAGTIRQCYNKSDNYVEYGIYNTHNDIVCTECYATNIKQTDIKDIKMIYYDSSSDKYYEGKIIMNVHTSPISIDANGLKSAAELKSPSFLSLLNADGDYFCPDYTNINNGYPILRWQLENTPFYTIKGICKAEQGTVSGAGEYPQGAQVKLTATPKDNYTFVGWSDGNTDNPRTISVDKAATYVAQFDRLSYTVYVNQDCSITVE